MVRKNIDNDPPDTEEWLTPKFDGHLTDVLGSAFSTLEGLPASGEIVRSGRGWPSTAGIDPIDSHIEKRIVDVALRDMLLKVFLLPVAAKPRWLDAVNALTLKTSGEQWRVFATALELLPDPLSPHQTMGERNSKDKGKALVGYVWASMLAALCHAVENNPGLLTSVYATRLTAADPNGERTERDEARHQLAEIIANTAQSDEVFAIKCFPRATASTIEYMTMPMAVAIAAAELAAAIQSVADAGVSDQDCMFIVRMIGAASSLDLWQHPAAVRYLLLPAIPAIRKRLIDEPEHVDHRDAPAAFNLDTLEQTVEDLIYQELVGRWRLGNNWGRDDDPRADEAAQAKREQDRAKHNEQAKERRKQQTLDTSTVMAQLTALQDDVSAIKASVSEIKRLLGKPNTE
ncbi:hypothetical protein [Mycobacteroides abscessus]|uniref:hypothetical protein n=1 Tax=Mycobacteroides abscessus TaxID=36809 RepID=UPI0009A68921|nr:hypothetical protein [Mycobacteroides abscessus]